MACPYFFPTQKSSEIYWPFPHRLPLGTGFSGCCTASGERFQPGEAELKDFCNIGYPGGCERFPSEAQADTVRFAIAKDGGDRILLHYSCERSHAPVEHGQLQFDCATKAWPVSHKDACIQRQAECYVSVYLERNPREAVIGT